MNSVVSFGLELVNLDGNGADAYFPVTRNMMLNTFNIDVASMLVSATAGGWAEVLCQGRVNRGGPPTFSGAAGYLPAPPSPPKNRPSPGTSCPLRRLTCRS